MTLSHDPEIRLRQKYDPSNRPFEDSLFLEVDRVSCGTPECEGAQYATSEANAAQASPAGIDICANKHKGAETSIAAHQRIAATSSELRQQIYSFALTSGERGITVKDVVARLGIVINSAAPRLTEMKRDGLLKPKGDERREGCSVLVPVYAK